MKKKHENRIANNFKVIKRIEIKNWIAKYSKSSLKNSYIELSNSVNESANLWSNFTKIVKTL